MDITSTLGIYVYFIFIISGFIAVRTFRYFVKAENKLNDFEYLGLSVFWGLAVLIGWETVIAIAQYSRLYPKAKDDFSQLLNNPFAAGFVLSGLGAICGWIASYMATANWYRGFISKISPKRKSITQRVDNKKELQLNYYKGNFRVERKERGGWIIGRFLDGFRENQFVAVKSWSFTKGQDTTIHSRKFEREATESTFILRGKVRGFLDGKEIILEGGDYVTIPPRVESNLVIEILDDTEGLTMKSPSLSKDDSVKLSD